MPFPIGMVIIWSSTVGTIPSGWLVCDGTNGTPDLRDRFVVGAGSTYPLNSTGGFTDIIVPTHTHTPGGPNTGGNHTHTVASTGYSPSGPLGIRTSNGASPYNTTQFTSYVNPGSHSHSGATVGNAGVDPTNRNLPPYRALFFIMKGGE